MGTKTKREKIKEPPIKKKRKSKRAPTDKKVGRPGEYSPSFCEDAYRFALLGASNYELATHFGISVSTLCEWKNKYHEFGDAITRGKIPADAKVANALYERANGAIYIEEVAHKLKKTIYGDNGKKISEEEYVEVVPLQKQAPPDTTAALKWLSNRRATAPIDSVAWRDKVEVDASVHGEVLSIDVDSLDEATKENIVKAYIRTIESDESKTDNK